MPSIARIRAKKPKNSSEARHQAKIRNILASMQRLSSLIRANVVVVIGEDVIVELVSAKLFLL